MSTFNIFLPIILYDKIKIKPNQLSNNIETLLLDKLNNKFSGKCHKHGLIKKNSIKILELIAGQIETFSFQGFIVYEIKFSALICKLPNSLNLIGTIVNKNDFALLCNFTYFEESINEQLTVVEVIIPLSTSEKIGSLINLSSVNINDKVQIEIIGNKYSIGDVKISALGKIIKKMDANSEMIFLNTQNNIIEEDNNNLVEDSQNEDAIISNSEKDDDDSNNESSEEETDESDDESDNNNQSSNSDNDSDDDKTDSDNNEVDDNDNDDDEDEEDSNISDSSIEEEPVKVIKKAKK